MAPTSGKGGKPQEENQAIKDQKLKNLSLCLINNANYRPGVTTQELKEIDELLLKKEEGSFVLSDGVEYSKMGSGLERSVATLYVNQQGRIATYRISFNKYGLLVDGPDRGISCKLGDDLVVNGFDPMFKSLAKRKILTDKQIQLKKSWFGLGKTTLKFQQTSTLGKKTPPHLSFENYMKELQVKREEASGVVKTSRETLVHSEPKAGQKTGTQAAPQPVLHAHPTEPVTVPTPASVAAPSAAPIIFQGQPKMPNILEDAPPPFLEEPPPFEEAPPAYFTKPLIQHYLGNLFKEPYYYPSITEAEIDKIGEAFRNAPAKSFIIADGRKSKEGFKTVPGWEPAETLAVLYVKAEEGGILAYEITCDKNCLSVFAEGQDTPFGPYRSYSRLYEALSKPKPGGPGILDETAGIKGSFNTEGKKVEELIAERNQTRADENAAEEKASKDSPRAK